MENMLIVKVIKRKIYKFLHPSVESLLQEFAITEKPISREEYGRCCKLIDEYFGEHDSRKKSS